MTSYPTRFALIANVIKCFRANVNQELVSEAPAFVLIGWKDHLNLSLNGELLTLCIQTRHHLSSVEVQFVHN